MAKKKKHHKDRTKTRTKAKGRDKKVEKVKKPRKSIRAAIFEYFDKVGVEKATYERAADIAESVKPDTAFNEQHFSWYKGQYKDQD